MSMLILPRRFSVKTASVDWSNPIAARFSAISVPLAGGLSRNFARPGGKPVQTYGVSTGTSIKVAAGLGGMGMDGTAITTQSHRLHSVANATSTAWEEPLAAATWFAVVVRRGNNANGNAPIFANGAPSTSPYNAYAIIDNGGSGTARVECAVGGSSYILDVGSIPNHRLTIIVGRYTGYVLEGFLNGAKQSSYVSCTGQVTYVNHVSRGPAVGNFYDYTTTARSFNGQIYLVGVAPVALSDAEIVALSADPWQLLAAPDDIIWLDAGGGGVTGSFAATESGSDTAVASAKVIVSGTLAASESGQDSAAIAGKIAVTGSLTANESGSDTAAIYAAQPPISGSFAATESGSDTAYITNIAVIPSPPAVDSGSGGGGGGSWRTKWKHKKELRDFLDRVFSDETPATPEKVVELLVKGKVAEKVLHSVPEPIQEDFSSVLTQLEGRLRNLVSAQEAKTYKKEVERLVAEAEEEEVVKSLLVDNIEGLLDSNTWELLCRFIHTNVLNVD